MKTIIIIQNQLVLRILLSIAKIFFRSFTFYYFFCEGSTNLKQLCDRYNIKEIRKKGFSKDAKNRVLKDYLLGIDKIADENGSDLLWWATNFAAKNRFLSPMQKLLSDITHFNSALNTFMTFDTSPCKLLVLNPNSATIETIRQISTDNHCLCRYFRVPFLNTILNFIQSAKRGREFLKSIFAAYLRIYTAKRIFMSLKSAPRNSDAIRLIKSFVYPGSIGHSGNYKDPFFGNLGEKLSSNSCQQERVITVALGFSNFKECYKKLRHVTSSSIVPFECFLKYRDIGSALRRWFKKAAFGSFQLPKEILISEFNAEPVFRQVLSKEVWSISLLQLLHFYAGKNLSDCYNVKECIITFENNPWEKMLMKGLRDKNPNVKIIGYQHAVVPQSAAGMFFGKNELKLSPQPDLILTTGKIPADILIKHGNFPSDRIYPSCALRYEYLTKIKQTNRNKEGINQVLVPLEGDKDVIPLVEYVKEQSSSMQDKTFRLRAHPSLPFERLVKRLKWHDVPENIEISQNKSVIDDINECDVVLYWGTTVALEAIVAGKPVIHFDRGDLLSFDPLFELDSFKWEVDRTKDLQIAIAQIESLSDEQFELLRQKASNYIEQYFFPITDKAIAKFNYFRIPNQH